MATSTISLRVDSDLKEDAQELFEWLGLDMSTAIKIFLRQSITESAIPFTIKAKLPKEEVIEALEDAEHMRNLTPAFDTAQDLMEYLDA